jgi:prevent-host-death family protein
MKTVSATDAKNRFGDLLDESALGPVRIDKNGRPIAYVLSAEDFDLAKDLIGLARVQSLIAAGDPKVLAVLQAFSSGDSSRHTAISALGLRDYGQLLRALRAAGMPAPVLPAADRARMVDDFVGVLNG